MCVVISHYSDTTVAYLFRIQLSTALSKSVLTYVVTLISFRTSTLESKQLLEPFPKLHMLTQH